MTGAADLLHRRRRSGSRADGAHLALVVEGGAMRAVVTAGMCAGIEGLGLLDAFDSVYGTSAGAINGAYLLAGQAELVVSIYSEVMNTTDFVDLRRAFLPGRPIISLDHALSQVAAGAISLDFAAFQACPIPLHVVAADLDTLTTEVFTGFETAETLMRALRASSHLPFFAGEPEPVGGRTFVDGMVNDPIPFRPAFAGGATHAVVLLSREPGGPAPYRGLSDWLIREVALRRHPRLRKRLRTRSERYVADVDWLLREAAAPGGSVLVVAPSGIDVSGFERDAATLRAGAAAGREALAAALSSAATR